MCRSLLLKAIAKIQRWDWAASELLKQELIATIYLGPEDIMKCATTQVILTTSESSGQLLLLMTMS